MKRILALTMAAAMAACVPTMTAAPAGAFDPGTGLTVNLQNSWTHVPANLNGAVNGSVLTRHGLALERVDILSIEPGQSLIRVPREVDAPEFRAGMSEPELVELVTSSLSRIGFTDLAAEDVRAYQMAGAPGVRFALTGKYASGLHMRGDAALAESGGKLNVILFLAPAAHYYDANANEIDALIQSARFSR